MSPVRAEPERKEEGRMAKSIKKIESEIMAAMQAVGTYKPDFTAAIHQLAMLLRDQEQTRKEYRDRGSQPLIWREGKNGEYQVKNPLLGILETQRRDAVMMLAQLGLTPTGLKKINDEMKKKPGASGLARRVAGSG